MRYRAQVAFSTARDIVTQLERITNRRKAVVWVSNGFDFNPVREAARSAKTRSTAAAWGRRVKKGSEMNQQINQGAQFADADLARELADLTRAANRANATFYTIDPRGLVAGQDLDETVDPTDFQDHIRKTQDSLRVLAEETGGIAIVNQNNFDKGLKRIDAETSDYYVVGYYSTQPRPAEAHAQDRSEGEARRAERVVAHVVHAAAADAADQAVAAGAARAARPAAGASARRGRAARRWRGAGARGFDRLVDPRLQPRHGLGLRLRERTPHFVGAGRC